MSADCCVELSEALQLKPGERWYLAHTLPKKEFGVEMRLSAQGFRNFLPRGLKTVRHSGRMREVSAPVFPRYIFVAINLHRDRWRCVNGTIGVASLFMADDLPLPVPSGVVETLILSSDPSRRLRFEQRLQPGQEVRLLKGPLADALGVLERVDARGRVEVLLKFMNGYTRVTLDREWVAPAA